MQSPGEVPNLGTAQLSAVDSSAPGRRSRPLTAASPNRRQPGGNGPERAPNRAQSAPTLPTRGYAGHVARRQTRVPAPGDDEYLPHTPDERRAHADALHQRAQQEPQPAFLFAQAGECYAEDGHDADAERMFRHSLAEPGAPTGTLHGIYADFLFDRGRSDEALTLLQEARRLKPEAPHAHVAIGETLLEYDHPAEAARWFTAGLVDLLGSLTEVDLDDLREDVDIAMLTRGRHEARQALNQPNDHLDEIYAAYRAELDADQPNA